MDKIFSEISEVLPLFEKAYLQHKNLSDATRYFVNELFGKDGLLILDGDDKELKNEFADIVKDELLNSTSYKKVSVASESINTLGYKSQVHPREINLFYIDNGLRERIVKEESVFKVLNSSISFSEEEILNVLKTNPEKFSPNVILRPVYQQYILPNVCYCGGPAEVAYWLQLKSLCDYHKVSFPILIPRNFALFVNKQNFKKLEKTGLAPEELLKPDHKLKEEIVNKLSGDGYKLVEETKSLDPVFQSMKEKASGIDVTLEGFVAAEYQKVLKVIEGIEKKFKKAEETKNEILISQILNLKAKLFPEGELQERSDNFLNFYINDNEWINKIAAAIDPFDFKFNIVVDNE
jgi:bacillithiol biosynthesis cysteine-adding enzyme BshC